MSQKHRILQSMLLLILLVAISMCLPLNAHVFSGVFDGNRPIAVTGSIVRVDLVKPDSWVHIRVEDPSTGNFVIWAFMTVPPSPLKGAYNLDATILKVGEKVRVIGWPEIPGANSTDHVQDLELANRLKTEKHGMAAQFEFANEKKFPVVQSVPNPTN